MEGLSLWQNAFGDALAGAAGRILPHATGLVWLFAVIGVLGIIFRAVDGKMAPQSAIRSAALLLLTAGGILYAENHAAEIKEAIISSGVTLGTNAGTTGIGANEFVFSPLAMLRRGFLKAIEIWTIAGNSCPPIYLGGCMSALPLAGPMFAVSMMIMLVYTAVAYRVVMAFVKATLGMLMAMSLMPAAVVPSLRALGLSPTFYMFNQALAIMSYAIIIAVGDAVIGRIAVDPQAIGLSGAAAFGVAAYFFWKSANEAPNIVREILSAVVAPAGQSMVGSVGKTVQSSAIGRGTQTVISALGNTGGNPSIGVLKAIGSVFSGRGGSYFTAPSGVEMTRNFGGPIYQGGAKQAQLSAMQAFPKRMGLNP